MNTFIVHVRERENFNISEFSSHMKTYEHWARMNPTLWMITFPGTSVQVRDLISQATNKTCEIMVVNISGDGWATLNISREITDWMTENV